jgi:hypothetical protein
MVRAARIVNGGGPPSHAVIDPPWSRRTILSGRPFGPVSWRRPRAASVLLQNLPDVRAF